MAIWRSASYYLVAGVDLEAEMDRLCRLPVFGGEALRRAMREGYGVTGVNAPAGYHGAYADALERRRSKARPRSSRPPHPGQLALASQTTAS